MEITKATSSIRRFVQHTEVVLRYNLFWLQMRIHLLYINRQLEKKMRAVEVKRTTDSSRNQRMEKMNTASPLPAKQNCSREETYPV